MKTKSTSYRRWTGWARVGLVAALAVLAFGCGGDDGGDGAEDNAGEASGAVIGWSNPNAANPILNALTDGIDQVAEANGMEIDEHDAGLDPDTQLTDLELMVSQGVDGIISWTLDPAAVETSYRSAADEGLPIVAFNSESEHFDTVIETEVSARCTPFEDSARYIAEQVPGASVLVIGGPPVPALMMRVDCFRRAAEAEGLEILGQQDNLEDSIDGGNQVAQELLTRHGDDVDAIWTYNDRTALGTGRALRSAGLEVMGVDEDEGVILIGVNGEPEAIDAIRSGDLTMTYDENPPEAGAAAAQALVPALAEDGTPDDMPAALLIESTRWDVSNVDDYVPWGERDVADGDFGVEVEPGR